MSLGQVTVLIVDDEPLVRSGLRAILESEHDLVVVGEVEDGADVPGAVGRLRPDLVLMDVRMPRIDGIEATRRLLAAAGPHPKVLVVTTFENDEYVYDALRAGASGFLLKRAPSEEIVHTIRTTMVGDALVFPRAIRALAETYGPGPDSTVAQARLTDREQAGAAPGGRGTHQRGDRRGGCTSASRPSRPMWPASWRSSAPGTARGRRSPPTSRGSCGRTRAPPPVGDRERGQHRAPEQQRCVGDDGQDPLEVAGVQREVGGFGSPRMVVPRRLETAESRSPGSVRRTRRRPALRPTTSGAGGPTG